MELTLWRLGKQRLFRTAAAAADEQFDSAELGPFGPPGPARACQALKQKEGGYTLVAAVPQLAVWVWDGVGV